MNHNVSLPLRVLVINGSPKGENSITLQYVRYLGRVFPEHCFTVVHVAQHGRGLERDVRMCADVAAQVAAADAVLWTFGVWVLGAPAQMMRFIELVAERNLAAAFSGKPSAILTTSIHYFDHLAHQYLRAMCEDLGMRVGPSISLDMRDLQLPAARTQLRAFALQFFATATSSLVRPRESAPLPAGSDFVYQPAALHRCVDARGRRILIMTDSAAPTSNQAKMAAQLSKTFVGGAVEVVSLADVNIAGGCVGCMRCGYDYRCRYRDGFTRFYDDKVRAADILIICGAIRGRHLSAVWKTFFDRAFFWNHTPSLTGKQIAYLVSGPLRQNHHLVEFLEASVTARQLASFGGIVTDEDADSARLDALIDSLAFELVEQAVRGYVAPRNFLAVAGLKLLRDEIWGRLRAVWQADHRYYARHGLFDFPHRERLARLFGNLAMLLCRLPWLRRRFYEKLLTMPARRLSLVVERADPHEARLGDLS